MSRSSSAYRRSSENYSIVRNTHKIQKHQRSYKWQSNKLLPLHHKSWCNKCTLTIIIKLIHTRISMNWYNKHSMQTTLQRMHTSRVSPCMGDQFTATHPISAQAANATETEMTILTTTKSLRFHFSFGWEPHRAHYTICYMNTIYALNLMLHRAISISYALLSVSFNFSIHNIKFSFSVRIHSYRVWIVVGTSTHRVTQSVSITTFTAIIATPKWFRLLIFVCVCVWDLNWKFRLIVNLHPKHVAQWNTHIANHTTYAHNFSFNWRMCVARGRV